MYVNKEIFYKLQSGNHSYVTSKINPGDISPAIRKDTKVNGQHPYAIVITCSDSRVIPEAIFSTGIGEIFTIRVAGNVILPSQLASVEYAAAHLGCKVIMVLGHTNCGAVGATIEGGVEGFCKTLTDEIGKAIGDEKDDFKACQKNVEHGVEVLKKSFAGHHEIPESETDIIGAVYDIESGHVFWL